MKPIVQLKMALAVVGLLAVHALEAADTPAPKGSVPVSGQGGTVSLPTPKDSVDHPVVPLPDAKGVAADIPVVHLPSNVELPKSVRDLEADFRLQAQQYVERQKGLSQRAETASSSERERIREQIKANRAQFLQQTRQIRSEIKDRIREVHRSIGNSRPLDGAGAERGSGNRRRR